MVTRILFDPRRDLTTGTTSSNPVTVEATPTGIREDGQVVIYPATLTFTINTAADILQLAPNTASNGWRLVIRQDGAIRQTRTVRVPDQASITYQALPDVNPSSFVVTPGTARQWDATFWALVTLIGGGGQGGGSGGAVSSVAGRTGAVTLTKADVSLGNVDNTSDLSKPVSTATASAITAAINALVAGAPAALDTLKEITDQLATDESAAAALTTLIAQRTISTAPVTLNSSGTLTANATNILNATSGPLTATLPTPTRVGQLVVIERGDTSLNLISLAGTVRGVTTGLPTLPGLGSSGESMVFAAESLTSWRVLASHKPKSLLDLQYATLASPTFTGTVSGITKTMVGLANVDNTADLVKPISAAQQSALDLKAPIASPTFTGTVNGITKAMVALGNVDNTSDVNKPVSTAQQAALDLKAALISPAFTGTPTVGGSPILTQADVDPALPTPIELNLNKSITAGTSLWARGGMETFPRFSGAGDYAPGTGVMWVTFFYAPFNLTINRLGVCAGATPGATRTLARLALFTASDTNDLALVARTASDTTIGAGAYGSSHKLLSNVGGYPLTYTLQQGVRYAVGYLQVGGTPNTIRSADIIGADLPPIMSARISGQTDIATTYAQATVEAGVHYQVAYYFGLNQ